MNSDEQPAHGPAALQELLLRRGWHVSGHVENRYVRMRPGDATSAGESLVIPINPEMLDYQDLLVEARITALNRFDLGSDAEIVKLITPTPDDVIRFTRQSAYPDGQIRWNDGEALVVSTRMSLIASAKATADRSAYFGHRLTGFANDYLEQVRMGQTEVGSFIVTAHARSAAVISTPKSSPLKVIATVADVSRTLNRALQTVRASIDEGHKTGSTKHFVDAVGDGVSKDLVAALQKSTESGGELSAAITFAEQPGAPQTTNTVPFDTHDDAVLQRAMRTLATAEPSRQVSITGWVKIVTRPTIGEAGLITVIVDSGSNVARVKVRVTQSQFQIASTAIVEERFVKVHGKQERENSTYWIYNPTVEIAEKIPKLAASDSSDE